MESMIIVRMQGLVDAISKGKRVTTRHLVQAVNTTLELSRNPIEHEVLMRHISEVYIVFGREIEAKNKRTTKEVQFYDAIAMMMSRGFRLLTRQELAILGQIECPVPYKTLASKVEQVSKQQRVTVMC